MIYVYGVTSLPGLPGELLGLADVPVESREVAGVTLLVSQHVDGQPETSDEAILRHAGVVEEVTRTGAAVLPARFGLVFDDEHALRRAVAERSDELRAGLRRVEGCVELGVRVLVAERKEPSAVVTGGGDYLRARLREETERERVATMLHEALGRVARDSRRSPPSGKLLLTAAYLVPEGAVDDFREEVLRLERSHPELGLVCTGPWPPYSFAAATATTETTSP